MLGSPTLGTLDYLSCTTVDYGGFTFIYQIFRCLAIESDKGMLDKGVALGIKIEWTPEHLVKDVDMLKVIVLMNGERVK